MSAVVLVDSDTELADSLARVLEDAGYSVRRVGELESAPPDGDEAIVVRVDSDPPIPASEVGEVLHAMRSPLSAVLGQAQLIERGIYGDTLPDVAAAAALVVRQARVMRSLLDRLDPSKGGADE